MRPRDAADAAVHDLLWHFIDNPNVEDTAIARCTVLQMIAPAETDADFLDVAYRHPTHWRATRKFLKQVGGDGILVLTGAALERMNASV